MKNFKNDVICLGEILIDFSPVKNPAGGKMTFEANPGGAPANVCCAASKLGAAASFIGKVGGDSFGKECRRELEKCGVRTGSLLVDKSHHTTFAFVTLSESGERSFTFCRNDGADIFISRDELPLDEIASSRFLHVGALSLADGPCREATVSAIDHARKSGVFISYDPNWRELLWNDRNEGIERSKSIFSKADFIKISEEELGLFFDCGIEEAAQSLVSQGAKLVCITLGKNGVYYRTKDFSGTVRTPEGDFPCIDTTGAGDSFTGALLYRLTRRKEVFSFSKEDLETDLMFANTAASICITRKGAIPALATLEEVESHIL